MSVGRPQTGPLRRQPAVMNAIYAATGKPVRNLPLENVKLV
jgi:CO/xanthine dehydrogenase Mo-binding subunit